MARPIRRPSLLARLTAAATLALAPCCGGPEPAVNAPPGPADSAAHAAAARDPTRIEIVGVDLRMFEDAVVRVVRLEGTVEPVTADSIVSLDDASRYTIEVETGETWIGYDDLAVVMNEYTFHFRGAPVSRLAMAREEDADERDRVELKGRLRGGLLTFEIEGVPEVTDDGRIRIRTKAIQALEIPVGGLLHALGLEAGDLMGHMEERGLTFEGDDLILDAGKALPPPRLRGRASAVLVEDEGLRLRFGPARPAPAGGGNYLAFRHGIIKIGRMTQFDAHLTITDADPRDPFDFFGERMNRQLAAGYSKMSEAGSLTMIVPDYDDMERGADLP